MPGPPPQNVADSPLTETQNRFLDVRHRTGKAQQRRSPGENFSQNRFIHVIKGFPPGLQV